MLMLINLFEEIEFERQKQHQLGPSYKAQY